MLGNEFRIQHSVLGSEILLMDSTAYAKAALRTMADQGIIRQRNYDGDDKTGRAHIISSHRLTQIDNAARGMAGDVGEVNTCVQQCLEYGKQLDLNNLLAELGDVQWRIMQMCDAVGFTLEQVFEANIAKLAKRYPEAYSDFLADEANRDRKQEDAAVEEVRTQTGQGFAEPPEVEELVRMEDMTPKHRLILVERALAVGFKIDQQALVPSVASSYYGSTASWRPIQYKQIKLRVPHWLPEAVRELEQRPPVVVDTHTDSNYNCSVCKHVKIHHSNQAGMCADCYVRQNGGQ